MLPLALTAMVSAVLMLAEATNYVSYWPDYWYPNQSQNDYRPNSKYPYSPPKDNYYPPPKDNYYPPPKDNYYPPPKDNYYPPPKDNYPDYYPPPKDNYPGYYPPPKDNYPDYYPPPALPKPRSEEAYPGRFLGMGTFNSHFGGRQIELVCSLRESDGEIVSNVVWYKIKGSYPHQSNSPPYECRKCTYYPINYDDHRIKAYDYHGKSILFIHEVHPEDYGTYRCSATSQRSYTGDIETVYQIVKL